MGKCVFDYKWLSDAKFSWVKEFKGDKHKAMCCVCNKVIDIEHIGESTLKSHIKGEKHKRNAGATSSSTQSVLMATFLHEGTSSSCDQSSESGPSCAEANNNEVFVPLPLPAADGQSTVKLPDGCQGRGTKIKELKEKKKRMKLDIVSFVKSADDFSVKAEETGQMTFVTKSNALRKAAKDKNLQLQDVEDKLNGKFEALKGFLNILVSFLLNQNYCISVFQIISVPHFTKCCFERQTSSTMAELFKTINRL